jgi:hypothetical protein
MLLHHRAIMERFAAFVVPPAFKPLAFKPPAFKTARRLDINQSKRLR